MSLVSNSFVICSCRGRACSSVCFRIGGYPTELWPVPRTIKMSNLLSISPYPHLLNGCFGYFPFDLYSEKVSNLFLLLCCVAPLISPHLELELGLLIRELLGFSASDRHLGAGICLDRRQAAGGMGHGAWDQGQAAGLLHDTCCQQAHLSFRPWLPQLFTPLIGKCHILFYFYV